MNPSIAGRLARVGTVLLLLALSSCNRVELEYDVQNHPVPAQAMNLTKRQARLAAEARAADIRVS